jgi:hypothetical protein
VTLGSFRHWRRIIVTGRALGREFTEPRWNVTKGSWNGLSRLFNPPHDQASPLANGAFDDLRIVDQVEELIVWVSSNKLMSSEEYYASEFSDDYLDAQADAGDYFLDESGFYFRLNSVEVSELVRDSQVPYRPAVLKINGSYLHRGLVTDSGRFRNDSQANPIFYHSANALKCWQSDSDPKP